LNSHFYQIDLNYYSFRRFELYLNLFAREKKKEYCANGPLKVMRAGCSWAGGPIAETGELTPHGGCNSGSRPFAGEPSAGWLGNGSRKIPMSKGPDLGGFGRKGLTVGDFGSHGGMGRLEASSVQ
jgi:hypothetical protein